MAAAIDKVNELPATADNPATIQLQSDVRGKDLFNRTLNHCILDLNGYVALFDDVSLLADNTLTITDSRPETVHYCTYMGAEVGYQFAAQERIGYTSTKVNGGVLAVNSMSNIYVYEMEDATAAGRLTIDGGTILGTGNIFIIDQNSENDLTPQLVIENGNIQFFMDTELDGEMVSASVLCNGEVVINGGNLYGTVVEVGADGEIGQIIDLAKVPADSCVKIDPAIKMVETEINGMKVYTAVDANASTQAPDPITTPNEPIADQPSNTTRNMIGIIVLGAATVVMLAGVSAAIGLAAKRRKHKVA